MYLNYKKFSLITTCVYFSFWNAIYLQLVIMRKEQPSFYVLETLQGITPSLLLKLMNLVFLPEYLPQKLCYSVSEAHMTRYPKVSWLQQDKCYFLPDETPQAGKLGTPQRCQGYRTPLPFVHLFIGHYLISFDDVIQYQSYSLEGGEKRKVHMFLLF